MILVGARKRERERERDRALLRTKEKKGQVYERNCAGSCRKGGAWLEPWLPERNSEKKGGGRSDNRGVPQIRVRVSELEYK